MTHRSAERSAPLQPDLEAHPEVMGSPGVAAAPAAVDPIDAVERVSSELAAEEDLDVILDIALRAALGALRLDAGSLVLLPEQAEGVVGETEADLVLRASHGLSRQWLESPLPLSRDRLFDRLALSGEVVVSENLQEDERVLMADRAAREGLASCIHAGMVCRGRPVGVMRLYGRAPRRFTAAERRLIAAIAHQAAVAVDRSRLLALRRRDRQLERQLRLAADVQRRMLPAVLPQPEGYELAARSEPSTQLGGDFYDALEIGGQVGLAVGDVVGTGLAAAMLMASVRATLRAHALHAHRLNELVARTNRSLHDDVRPHEFATLVCAALDPAAHRLTLCSAGHEPVLLFRPGRPPRALDAGGLPLGIDPDETYRQQTVRLSPGDVVVFYTDGIADATNFRGERFGRARLRSLISDVVSAAPELSARGVVERVFWHIRQFAGIKERPDDLTVLAVRVRAA